MLQKKEIEQSIRKSELYLHEDDVVRRLSFQWDDRLIYRECTMQDRDNVEQLYQKFIIRLPFYVPGDIHLEQLNRMRMALGIDVEAV